MMKQFLLIGLLTGFVMTGIAQTSNDPAAKKILDGVSAKFKTYKGVQAMFTLKVEDGKGKLQGNQKGSVSMKGNKYKVTLAGKENKEIYSDGINTWTYDKASNEVTITKYESSAKTISPEKLFTNFYEKDFLYKLNGDVKQGGKTLQEIELTPVDKTKTFFKAYLYVEKKSQTINSLKWLEKTGNKYTLVANKLNGNAHIADSQFTFDKSKFPGVEEVDLRN